MYAGSYNVLGEYRTAIIIGYENEPVKYSRIHLCFHVIAAS